jgi:hypothetical protein
VASGYDMRVGDAERDAAANDLREHFASGRLTQDELNERLDQTFAAKTRADLSGLFTDLPSSTWQGAATSRSLGLTPDQWSDWGSGSGGRTPFGDDAFGRDGGAGGRQGGYGRRSLGAVLVPLMVVLALFTVSLLSVFGLGGPRPFGFALLLAAFALLRRLVFIIIGRRRGGRGGPRRGGRGGPRRRRW